jgi:hypothetical protein
MQEVAKNPLLVLVALFPIVDPVGGSPFILARERPCRGAVALADGTRCQWKELRARQPVAGELLFLQPAHQNVTMLHLS